MNGNRNNDTLNTFRVRKTILKWEATRKTYRNKYKNLWGFLYHLLIYWTMSCYTSLRKGFYFILCWIRIIFCIRLFSGRWYTYFSVMGARATTTHRTMQTLFYARVLSGLNVYDFCSHLVEYFVGCCFFNVLCYSRYGANNWTKIFFYDVRIFYAQCENIELR